MVESDDPMKHVDVYIKCRNLKDLEFIGQSDPMVIVSEFEKKSKTWKEIGRTAVATNDLNPDF